MKTVTIVKDKMEFSKKMLVVMALVTGFIIIFSCYIKLNMEYKKLGLDVRESEEIANG